MDAMVTARMPIAKKEAANRVLEELGSNPSQAINQFFDYLVREKSFPWSDEEQEGTTVTKERLQEALAWVDSISLPPDNRFAHMTDEEIKRERFVSRGLMEA